MSVWLGCGNAGRGVDLWHCCCPRARLNVPVTHTHTQTHKDTHRHTHTDTQRYTQTHTHRHTDTARTGPLSPACQILWSGQRNAGVPPLAPSGREVLSIPGGGGEPPAALPGLGLNRSPTWFPMWRERLPLLPDSNPRAVSHTCSPSLALPIG